MFYNGSCQRKNIHHICMLNIDISKKMYQCDESEKKKYDWNFSDFFYFEYWIVIPDSN